ncbi:MAG: oxygenase MpaB family protein [Leptospiraceae bacterium]
MKQASPEIEELKNRMAPYFFATDVLADAVVEDFSRLRPGEGNAILALALKLGIDQVPQAPGSVRDMFSDIERTPLWVDWDEIEFGANAFMRTGPFGPAALMCHSLPTGYLDPLSSKPLVFSGRLVQRARRRLDETAGFVYECCSPGGLRPGSRGFQVTIRVRLMHAQVRRLLLKSGTWDTENWGMPINQWQMLGSNVLFSLAVIRALRRWGLYISTKEEQAMYSIWRYNGFLLGIDRDILPATSNECGRILEVLEFNRQPADEPSIQLMSSLLDAGSSMAVDVVALPMRSIVRSMLSGLTRNLLGAKRAGELGLRFNIWQFLPYCIWPLVRFAEVLRLLIPGAGFLAIRVGQLVWHRTLNAGLKGKDAKFEMPAKLNSNRKGED